MRIVYCSGHTDISGIINICKQEESMKIKRKKKSVFFCFVMLLMVGG